jgi:hypothetical protein
MPVEVNVTEDLKKGESIVLEAGSLNSFAVEATQPAMVSNEAVEVMPIPIPSGIVYANMPLFLAYDNADGLKNLTSWDIEQLLRKQ